MNSSSLSSLVDVTRRAGLLDPRRLPALTAAIGRWGPTLAAPYAASALATPNRTAVVDDRGSISCGELDRNSTQLANGLRQLGLDRGERLGIACRNHREFVEATIAAAKLGVSVVYLNTGFAAPQLRDVLAREQVDVLVVDAELVELVFVRRGLWHLVARVDRHAGAELPVPDDRPLACADQHVAGAEGVFDAGERDARLDAQQELVAILGELLDLRGPLERAAADASLALWALAWQPSNRAAAVPVVTAPLVRLYEEGRDAAADDAGAVLSVLVKTDANARGIIGGIAPHGEGLVRYLLEKEEELESPKAGGNTSVDNFFKRMNSAQNSGIGPSRLSVEHPGASPGLSRCIKGQYN